MQFKVPQFLEIEDKIFGPFTFRQFIYLAGGAGMCFVLYKVLGFWLSVVPVLALGAFALLLAFYRPNDKPFINMVEAGVRYVMQNKLYIWKRRQVKVGAPEEDGTKEKMEAMSQNSARLTGSKLRDLAWSLDVLDLKKNTEH